jgi:hypothetical protein
VIYRLIIAGIAFGGVALISLGVWLSRLPPEAACIQDAGFHDPHYVITGMSWDMATGCITSIKTRPR